MLPPVLASIHLSTDAGWKKAFNAPASQPVATASIVGMRFRGVPVKAKVEENAPEFRPSAREKLHPQLEDDECVRRWRCRRCRMRSRASKSNEAGAQDPGTSGRQRVRPRCT